jgi:hypothetical protein
LEFSNLCLDHTGINQSKGSHDKVQPFFCALTMICPRLFTSSHGCSHIISIPLTRLKWLQSHVDYLKSTRMLSCSRYFRFCSLYSLCHIQNCSFQLPLSLHVDHYDTLEYCNHSEILMQNTEEPIAMIQINLVKERKESPRVSHLLYEAIVLNNTPFPIAIVMAPYLRCMVGQLILQ